MKIRIATRGSELALAQSRWVASELEKLGAATELVIIRTQGDIQLDKPLHEIGGKGLFTKEVDRAVLERQADVSVHSLKDMPVEDEEGLVLGAIPRRESSRDVLVSNNAGCGIIGCGSLRRRAQVARLGLGYTFADVRGNIHTRLAQMQDKGWSGLVVAEAALVRLGLAESYDYEVLDILPAAGQGALGLRIREGENDVAALIGKLNCVSDAAAAYAESRFLKALGGGCSLPAGIRSEVSGGNIAFTGGIFSVAGDIGVVQEKKGSLGMAAMLAQELAHEILLGGGAQILDKMAH